ncbi:MAG: T9SS type A sorting domain-containing protein [Lewinellaceae bacterium]|nr:T9SS type A sorting domain-containing protein [Lewinellaceae bacterium]
MGILDASIQIGKEQLLLLLGVKADAASCGRPLCIEDVSVLGMEVQSSWTGAAVADFIRRNMCLRPGATLSYVICGQGTNLLAALRSLGLPWASDCSHVMMNLAKALFNIFSAKGQKIAGEIPISSGVTNYSLAGRPSGMYLVEIKDISFRKRIVKKV